MNLDIKRYEHYHVGDYDLSMGITSIYEKASYFVAVVWKGTMLAETYPATAELAEQMFEHLRAILVLGIINDDETIDLKEQIVQRAYQHFYSRVNQAGE